jgi:hypothetical protein
MMLLLTPKPSEVAGRPKDPDPAKALVTAELARMIEAGTAAIATLESGTPEVEIGERRSEIGHEGLDVITTLSRFMQRILQQHVRRCNLVHHAQIAGLVPEVGEPTADNGLAVILQAHGSASRFIAMQVTD